jgi:hypothetical protein
MRHAFALIMLACALCSCGKASKRPTWDQAFISSVEAQLVDSSGKAVAAGALSGKCIVLLMSANWCPQCHELTPELIAHYRAHGGGSAYEIVLINEDESEEQMLAYMTASEMPWLAIRYDAPLRLQLDGMYNEDQVYPYMVVIDRHGTVVATTFRGDEHIDPPEILAALDRAIAEKP